MNSTQKRIELVALWVALFSAVVAIGLFSTLSRWALDSSPIYGSF